MLRPRKHARRPIEPLLVFNHAVRFVLTEEHVRGSTTRESATSYMAPIIVMSAFASELLLKCIYLLDRMPLPDTHRLDILYRRLHNKRKQRIEELWNAKS